MEREILFRGKRLDGGEWVEGNYYESDMSGCFILQNIQKKTVNARTGVFSMRDVPIPYEVDPDTVGQYTGLKDRNGKKVFEGDILKWDEEWPDYCEVAMWDYELLEMRKNDWAQFCKVIGNRWDNPELLEVRK